jgi:peptidoglycan L-alanyl-D-glutamate endopeptidase CwlK
MPGEKMPKFSEQSLEKLSTCHPELQLLFNEVIKTFDCTIAQGHRGEAEQNKAFEEGKSKLRWPNGNHNKMPSMAVDVYPYPVNLNPKNVRDAEIYKWRMSYFAGQVKAIARQLKEEGKMKFNLVWGCDWDDDTELTDHTFFDFPHFELR